jgi:hypothetical protein
MPDYGNPLYWQERYAYDPSASFDWYATYEEIKSILDACGALPRRSTNNNVNDSTVEDDFEIFIPGCGNSTLPVRLHADGYPNISCVDISSVVISQLTDRYRNYTEMDFSVLDVTDMPKNDPPDNCFDLIIDKALMDSLLCSEDAIRKISTMIRNMYRILKTGGTYIVVSHGTPISRLGLFTPPGVAWIPHVVQLGKSIDVHIGEKR